MLVVGAIWKGRSDGDYNLSIATHSLKNAKDFADLAIACHGIPPRVQPKLTRRTIAYKPYNCGNSLFPVKGTMASAFV